MAAYRFPESNRALAWMIAGFLAFEAFVQSVVALTARHGVEAIIWLVAAGLMFATAAIIENVKLARGD